VAVEGQVNFFFDVMIIAESIAKISFISVNIFGGTSKSDICSHKVSQYNVSLASLDASFIL
jgi:hypothetical protein